MLQTVCHTTAESHDTLEELVKVIARSNRVIAITGAGIRCTSAGIPDFESLNLNRPDGPALIKLCLELFEHAETSQKSLPHRLLMDLLKSGQLVRTYTQNIDCLEEQAGLCINVSKGPGVFISDPTSDTTAPLQPSLPRGVECVQLHGSIRLLRCIKCRQQCTCSTTSRRGRTLQPGLLRPGILLYNELDLRAQTIAEIIQHNLSLDVDLLLILGTSLIVHGIQKLTRKFAKLAHKNDGIVLYINQKGPPRKHCIVTHWDGVVDYWVEWK
ncbi:DHS-like NAD/FAD-binding domain-containing protein [Nemania sp. FL0031]|nr:DHS-like NAD/FAD-binding domain-containing protein [Nemania sp. FL0031]